MVDAKLRNKSIDALKGIGIILMVLGHMHYSESFEKFVFGFHMPLFFCVSGYLYNKPTSLREYTTRKVQSLLAPYLSFGVLYSLASGVFYGKDALIKGLGVVLVNTTYDMPIESALWFLLALFWVTIGYSFIDGKIWSVRIKTCIIISITLIGVCWTMFFHYLPWAINSAMSALGFYAIGVWFRNTGEARWEEIMKDIHPVLKILGFSIAFVGFGYIIMINGFLNIRTGTFGIAPIGYAVTCIYIVDLFCYSVLLEEMVSFLVRIYR